MYLIDANLLIYAYDSSSPHHGAVRPWFEDLMSRPLPVRLTWTNILAFLRITTNPRILTNPFSAEEAMAIVESWLAQPQVDILGPTQRHFEILQNLIREGQVKGPMVMDAHLATLAVEHGATLCTTDRDFARFGSLRRFSPLDGKGWLHESARGYRPG